MSNFAARAPGPAWRSARAKAVGVAWCVWALASVAQAQPTTGTPLRVALRWSAPPECADASAMKAAVEQRLGRAAFVETRPDVVLEASVEARSEGGFRARLALVTPGGARRGERVLETARRDCRAIDATLSVVVAILVGVERDAVVLDDTASAAPSVEAQPAVTRASPRRSHAPRRRALRPPAWLEVSAAPTVTLGLVPGAALGARVQIAARIGAGPALALRVGGSEETRVAIGEGAIRFRALAGELLVCPWTSRFGRLRAAMCGLGSAVHLSVEPNGYALERPTSDWTLTLGAGATASVTLFAGLSVGLALDLATPLIPRTYTHRDAGGVITEVFRVGPLVAAAALTVAWRLDH